MRPNQKRGRGLSPLVIRALGVLAITLMAMTTPPASSASVPNCKGWTGERVSMVAVVALVNRAYPVQSPRDAFRVMYGSAQTPSVHQSEGALTQVSV